MAAPRPASKRLFSRPVFDEHITIHSDHAQRLLDRGLFKVAAALYAIDVILRIVGDDTEMDQVEAVVTALIGDCAQAMHGEEARLEALRKQSGLSRIPRYLAPRSLTVHVSSPQMAQYTALIQSLDRLMIGIDTLWLSGVMSNKQRANGCYEWRIRLLRVGREIVTLERRARASADRQGMSDEVRAETGDTAVVVERDAPDAASVAAAA
jgi:Tfp pilus assembly protein PilO